jgi:hypothetical protein
VARGVLISLRRSGHRMENEPLGSLSWAPAASKAIAILRSNTDDAMGL